MKAKNKESKPWYKKVWVWLLIIALIAIFGGAAGGNKNSADNSGSTNSGSGQGSQAKEEEKTEFKVNEPAKFDNKTVTVTAVERNYSTGNQFSQPETGKEFVLVTVDIKNDGKDSLNHNTLEFKMQDSNGVQQNESFMAISEGKLSSGSLAPGGHVSGKIAYEVPQGDTGLKLLYQNISLFNNKPITFILQ